MVVMLTVQWVVAGTVEELLGIGLRYELEQKEILHHRKLARAYLKEPVCITHFGFGLREVGLKNEQTPP